MLIRLDLRAESALLCHRVKAGFLTEQENVYCFPCSLSYYVCGLDMVREIGDWVREAVLGDGVCTKKKKKISTPKHSLQEESICVEKMNLAKPLGFLPRGTASGNGCQKGRLTSRKELS